MVQQDTNRFLQELLELCKPNTNFCFKEHGKKGKKYSKETLDQWFKEKVPQITKSETFKKFDALYGLNVVNVDMDCFCPDKPVSKGHAVLHLVIWSQFRTSIYQDIKSCLEDKIQSSSTTTHDFLIGYVHCVKCHVWYSVSKMNQIFAGKKADYDDVKPYKHCLESLCLNQAVRHSTTLFGKVLNKQKATTLLIYFNRYTRKHKPKPTLYCPNDLKENNFSHNDDEDLVKIVSIMDCLHNSIWLCMGRCLNESSIKQMLENYDAIKKNHDFEYETIAKTAADNLGIETSDNNFVHLRLLALALLVRSALHAPGPARHTLRSNDFTRMLLDTGIIGSGTKKLMKDLVQLQDPFLLSKRITHFLIRDGGRSASTLQMFNDFHGIKNRKTNKNQSNKKKKNNRKRVCSDEGQGSSKRAKRSTENLITEENENDC